jgi:hypothetical protein
MGLTETAYRLADERFSEVDVSARSFTLAAILVDFFTLEAIAGSGQWYL